MTLTAIYERPVERAKQFLAREIGAPRPDDLVQYLGNAPVRCTNAVLASWGIPPVTESGALHQALRRADYTARSTVDGFLAFVSRFADEQGLEADPDALDRIASSEAERTNSAVSGDQETDAHRLSDATGIDLDKCRDDLLTTGRYSERPPSEQKVPQYAVLGGSGTLSSAVLNGQAAVVSPPVQQTLPGMAFGEVDGDGDPSRATPPPVPQVQPAGDGDGNDTTRTAVATGGADDSVRRTLLEAEGIVVLRKVSRKAVQGGYSMSKPDLVNAILAADLSVTEIARRIKAAK